MRPSIKTGSRSNAGNLSYSSAKASIASHSFFGELVSSKMVPVIVLIFMSPSDFTPTVVTDTASLNKQSNCFELDIWTHSEGDKWCLYGAALETRKLLTKIKKKIRHEH